MSYSRVIPRDLFNEAKLLKCMGKLVIEAETSGNRVHVHCDGDAFNIDLGSDYRLYVINIEIEVNGVTVEVGSTYNSKANWPLFATYEGEDIEVLDEGGKLTPEFLAIGRESRTNDSGEDVVDESLITRLLRAK